MDLYHTVHPNRGMLYFLLAAAIILLIVFWYSQLFVIEQESDLSSSQEIPQPPANPAGVSVDTTGWKTYRNEEYGFEFEYPKQLILYEQREDLYEDLVNLTIGDVNQPDDLLRISVGMESLVNFHGDKYIRCCDQYFINNIPALHSRETDVIALWFDGKSYTFDIYDKEIVPRILDTLIFFKPKQ